MRLGVTGASGFIGWHLQCYLKTIAGVEILRTAGREDFENIDYLVDFVQGLDCIIHLAGVNRAEEGLLFSENLEIASKLVQALEAAKTKASIIFTSSTHAINAATEYGKGKAAATELISGWAKSKNVRFINMLVPHVFGEHGRPYYNSGLSTFCHQIVNGEQLKINPDGVFELIHVQRLAKRIADYVFSAESGEYRVEGIKISTIEVVNKLEGMYENYMHGNQLPELETSFSKELFNTLRSYIPYKELIRMQQQNKDERGSLVETVKARSGGQCFVSTTRPGITRGNHFHLQKVERFFVLKGRAVIRLRKLFTEDVYEFEVSGDNPAYIDIPTLHTHSITNTGIDELTTLFWADEIFDPNNSDTYVEEVVV